MPVFCWVHSIREKKRKKEKKKKKRKTREVNKGQYREKNDNKVIQAEEIY